MISLQPSAAGTMEPSPCLPCFNMVIPVIFPKNSTAYSDTSDPMIKNVEDYYKIKKIDPTQTPRMKMLIDATRILSKAKGKEVGIVGFVYGPLGVLSQMRGHERLLS